MAKPGSPDAIATVLAVVLSNAMALGLALWQDWPLGMLLWPYWLQSVVIGGFSAGRILALRDFSTRNLKFNGRPVPEEPASKRKVAAFFACHYGLFHLVYFFFLSGMAPLPDPTDVAVVVLCGLGFAVAQRFSFRRQASADASGRPNLGFLMFLPYLRIVPMHLAIILGIGLGTLLPLLVFTALKTLADAGMALLEQRISEKSAIDWLEARERSTP